MNASTISSTNSTPSNYFTQTKSWLSSSAAPTTVVTMVSGAAPNASTLYFDYDNNETAAGPMSMVTEGQLLDSAQLSPTNGTMEGTWEGNKVWAPDFPDAGYMMLFFILAISGVLGILGNGCVLILSRVDKTLMNQSLFNFLLLLLCWCGLAMSVLGTPLTAISNYSRRWLFGRAGCHAYGAVMTVLGLVQQDTLVLIAAYRYISLCKPLAKHRLTKKCLYIAVVICFVEATVWAIAPLLGWGEYVLEGVGTSCGPNWSSQKTSQWSYTLSLAVTHLFVPMPILIFCYASIIMQLQKLKRVRNAPYLNTERKIFPLVVAITVGFIFANVPYGFISVVTLIFGKDVLQHPLVTTVPAILMKMSCFWNSLIYFTTDQTYRTAVRSLFKNRIHVVQEQ